MSTTYINALLQTKAPATLDEATIYAPIEKSSFITMLEFNEELIIADLRSTRDFYNGLLESGDYVLDEGVFAAIGGFLSNAILTITNIFKYIFGNSDQPNKSHKQYEATIKRNIDKLKKNEESFMKGYKAHRFSSKREITVFKRPSGYNVPQIENVMNRQDVQILTTIINEANKLCQDLKSKQIAGEEAKKLIQELIAKEKTLTSSIGNFEVGSLFGTETVTVAIGDHIVDCYRNIGRYTTFIENKANVNKCMQDLKISDITNNLNTFKMNLTADNGEVDALANDIRALAVAHTELAKAITDKINTYVTSMYVSLTKETSQLVKLVNNLLNIDDEEDNDDIVDEMAYFENAIDAELTTYRWTMMELYKEGIVKEAVIKANKESDVFYEMQILNEGIASKAMDAFKRMIAKLKEIFQKFMQKIRSNLTSDRNFITKYKKVILNNKLPAQQYKANDCLKGMDSLLTFRIDTFNYMGIKNNLNDNATFANYLLGQNRAINHSTPVSIQEIGGDGNIEMLSTYFKEYFGVRTEGNMVTINSSELESRMKDIYDFMYDVANLEKMFNKDLTSIEKIEKEAMRQANMAVGTVQTQSQTVPSQAASSQTSVNASYFSYIDNLNYFLEVPQAVAPQPAVNAGSTATNNQTQKNPNYSNMTGRVANNVNQFRGDTPTTNNGQKEYGTAGANLDELSRHCQVYTTVVSTIIKAKLTALEAIRSDFKWLFNEMVKHYIGGTGQSANRNANNSQEFIDLQNQQ